MRLRKYGPIVFLLIAGMFCTLGNIWVTAYRSTIPIALEGTVAEKDIGREKHPGQDDVHWLEMEGGQTLHIDSQLWKELREGDHLQKEAWSAELLRDGLPVSLDWSYDFRGMVPTMLAAIALIALLLVRIVRLPKSLNR